MLHIKQLLLIATGFALWKEIHGLVSPSTFKSSPARQERLILNVVLPEHLLFQSTSIHSAVDIFDGSQIVDPVVVSTSYWNTLGRNIMSLIIGQFLAAIIFAIVGSLLANQLPKFTNMLAEKIFPPPFRDDMTANNNNIAQERKTLKEYSSDDGRSIDLIKLIICIFIDVVGASSELIPILGELTDVIYAPLAALALRSLYGSNVVFVLEFTEEILPFTDILPLATLCWVVETFYADSRLAQALQIRPKRRLLKSDSVIDVTSNNENGKSP